MPVIVVVVVVVVELAVVVELDFLAVYGDSPGKCSRFGQLGC